MEHPLVEQHERMTSNFTRVKQFMLACGQTVLTQPTWPEDKLATFRHALIAEEFGELEQGLGNQDIVEVADALTDLLYVIYGAGIAFGIDLDACFKEVHRSNMTKVGADGKVLKNEVGKVIKPATYEPPNLEKILTGDYNNGC